MKKNTRHIFRFAPSPSGYLHVGGARTAIFNWLLAQKYKGYFRLRVEDTDKERSSDLYINQIQESLNWLGIYWDDDVIRQSDNKDKHMQIAEKLLETGKAYRCFCSREEINAKKEYARQNRLPDKYDQTCRNIPQTDIKSRLHNKDPFVIRLNIDSGVTKFTDGVFGEIAFHHDEIEDFVILRTDKSPIYHLAVVADDHDMGITHVVRGADHLKNTQKQILILKALKWKIPDYTHLPLILGQDRSRLSKRHGAASVEEFREKGYFADALFNYLCLLGWSAGDDSEIMSRSEIVEKFSLDNIHKANAVFDEKKLNWMNSQYIIHSTAESLADLLSLKKEKNLLRLINLVKLRAKNLYELKQGIAYYFEPPADYEDKGKRKYFSGEEVIENLEAVKQQITQTDSYNQENIEKIIRNYAESKTVSAAKIIHPVRLALTGRTTSPGLFEVMEILGKNRVIFCLDKAIEFIKQNIE